MPDRPGPTRLTDVAQARVAEIVRAGDHVVDATVGNGHDTRFLAEAVGPNGHVWGFDIQAQALDTARERLREAGLGKRVTLFHRGHQDWRDALPGENRGRLAAVMFNLGYLPGGDKRLITRKASTLIALTAAYDWLRPGGILTVMVYPNHPGGRDEAAATAEWLESLPAAPGRELIASPGPRLWIQMT